MGVGGNTSPHLTVAGVGRSCVLLKNTSKKAALIPNSGNGRGRRIPR